jgi:hypothetical protein
MTLVSTPGVSLLRQATIETKGNLIFTMVVKLVRIIFSICKRNKNGCNERWFSRFHLRSM